jgi:hypothetical protein
MDPRREDPTVFLKTVEGFGQKALVAEDSAEVRHLAYAKDTPPKYATLPTARALLTYSIPGIDAKISFSFEGGVKH